MRCQLICLALVSVGLWCGCRQASTERAKDADVLFRCYFAGFERLARDTNAARWVALENLPATRQLQEQTLHKLAKVPFQLFAQRIAATNNFALLIQPLLDDLTRVESFAELREATNQHPEFALVARLEPLEAEVWSTNLSTILSAWTGVEPKPIQVEGCRGWELKKHHAPNLIQFLRAGQWVVVSFGQDILPLQVELLQRISRNGRPLDAANSTWLDLWADWPRLEAQLPVALPIHPPQMHFTVTGKEQDLRTRMDLVFSNAVPQTFEPWRIPTNTIREPLVSFTAGRGIAPWLQHLTQVHRWGLDLTFDQFYLWAVGQIPFQTFLAVPVQNATNALERLAAELTTRFGGSLAQHGRGTIAWSTNTSRIVWEGTPFVIPFVEPVSEPAGQFLLAGVFPNVPKPKPPPAELLSQLVGRTNLIYYDWEITQQRVNQCNSLYQLYQIVFDQKPLGTNAAAMRWLNAITPELGNAVTEVTVAGPKQLTLVRKSAIGLTGAELVALANWLESPGFPLGGLHLSARTTAAESIPGTNSANAETRR